MVKRIALVIGMAVALSAVCVSGTGQRDGKLKALIIDGQNNHDWKATTPYIRATLEDSGLFTVDVATAGNPGEFRMEFETYDVLISNYNGPMWPKETRQAFLRYMRQGGGLVVIHAADNSFPGWEEYNRIIGLGGWGGRDANSGPYVYFEDGELVRDTSSGRAGTHGAQRAYPVVTRKPNHPIMKGLPKSWLHARDELYSKLRGPAENMTVLASAYSKKTKRNEPVLLTTRYGGGRCFHTVLGHGPHAMSCVGHQFTLQRGTEWAATGEVTLESVPENFPPADKVSVEDPTETGTQ